VGGSRTAPTFFYRHFMPGAGVPSPDCVKCTKRERKINSHVKQLSKLGVNIPDSVLIAASARLKDR